MNEIRVVGAIIHNLKNIDVTIPKGKMILITGVSGSGKSSLAFDIIFDEGMNRYLQSIGFPPKFEDDKPFDMIEGLSPTVALEQRTTRVFNPRSTVGTKTGIYSLIRILYATEGILICPICKDPVNQSALECESCGMVVDRKQIKHFSFNEPSGMCLACKGRGYETNFTEELIVRDYSRNLIQITKAGSGCFADQLKFVEQLPKFFDFDISTPYKDLPQEIKDLYLYGSKGKSFKFWWESKSFQGELERVFEGVIPHMKRAMTEGKSDYRRNKITKEYMSKKKCEECQGYRINEEAREINIAEKHIGELAMMTIEELKRFFNTLNDESLRTTHGKAILENILQGLDRMEQVGLSYLHLNRSLPTLSGGELQRLSLMTHLDGGLDSLIYVLDEPSMSLHEQEKDSLVHILQQLKDLGNTIIVVEHDKRFINLADQIIDIGPGAGIYGGEIVYQGPLEGIKKVKKSHTGQYLSGSVKLPVKKGDGLDDNTKFLVLKNANTNNLKNLTVKFPLGLMVGIAGVSGSGKSSLILDTLVPLLNPLFKRGVQNQKRGKDKENGEEEENDEDLLEYSGKVEGWENFDGIIVVNQKPISRVRTSTPCSFIGIWDKIRKLFAKTADAKKNKYTAGHFSYNSDNGRCPACKGLGYQDLQVSFLTSFEIPCKECKGTRYKPEILEIQYKGHSIADILEMTINQALEVFKQHDSISKVLKILDEIGMGYIELGQPAPTLSGGEAQRIKLAKELGKIRKGKYLYILDEPTVGLSAYDAIKLMELLERLVQDGNTVLIIEHDVEILSFCDYIIELGPEGGPKGGKVIAQGTPEDIKSNKKSITGPYLS
ncbi:MAG: excinuclease ABC subunit UvrA [Promethearchaeota archaeon]